MCGLPDIWKWTARLAEVQWTDPGSSHGAKGSKVRDTTQLYDYTSVCKSRAQMSL